MNVDDQIKKLEALLARVKSRAHAPGNGTNGAANGSNGPSPTNGVRAKPVITDLPDDLLEPPPQPFPPPPASGTRLQTLPPPDFHPPPPSFVPPPPKHTPRPPAPPIGIADDASIDRTLEDAVLLAPLRAPQPSQIRGIEVPPLEVIELDIDPDPSVPPPAPPPLPSEEPLESRSRLVSAPPVQLPIEADDEEPAPSSSRRPISLEEKMHALAEEDEASGHHDAPPESGRLPAAPAVLALDQESTGVRRSDEVAAFEGAAQPSTMPATFGELIAATLTLGER